MTITEFRYLMIMHAIGAGKVLCEITMNEDVKKEPEQVRKNVATILTLLTETEEFLKEFKPMCVQSSDK